MFFWNMNIFMLILHIPFKKMGQEGTFGQKLRISNIHVLFYSKKDLQPSGGKSFKL